MNAEAERRIQAFKNKSYIKLLGISYLERKTNEYVLLHVHSLEGRQEPLLSIVKKRKLGWFGHTVRHLLIQKPFCKVRWKEHAEKFARRNSWIT